MQKSKLSQENAIIKKKQDLPEDFDQRINDSLANMQDQNQRGYNYAQQYLRLLSDRTVPDNQDPRVKKGEAAFITTLVDFASELNSSPDNRKKDILSDLGSNSLITLLVCSGCLGKECKLFEKLSSDEENKNE